MKAETLAYLKGLLTEEIDFFSQFCQILATERQALASNDYSGLDDSINRKQTVVFRLQTLANTRQTLLPTDIQAASALLSNVAPDLLPLWQKLLKVAGEAHEANKINGMVIENRLQNNQQAIHLLQTCSQLTAAYSSDGQAIPANYRRTFGRA